MLNILSIDLDWFNIYHDWNDLRHGIQSFFRKLSSSTQLVSSTIAIVTEHHYLYPWCLHLLDKHQDTQVSIVNVDEHHDFYNLRKFRWSSGRFKKPVDCGNFFAFMAYDRILSRYDWVVSNDSIAALQDAGEFRKSVGASDCADIRSLLDNSTVWESKDIMTPIREYQLFHGLLISKSPRYTRNYKLTLKTTLTSLEKYFPNHSIRFHKCRKDFQYGHRRKIGMKRVIA